MQSVVYLSWQAGKAEDRRDKNLVEARHFTLTSVRKERSEVSETGCGREGHKPEPRLLCQLEQIRGELEAFYSAAYGYCWLM